MVPGKHTSMLPEALQDLCWVEKNLKGHASLLAICHQVCSALCWGLQPVHTGESSVLRVWVL